MSAEELTELTEQQPRQANLREEGHAVTFVRAYEPVHRIDRERARDLCNTCRHCHKTRGYCHCQYFEPVLRPVA